MGTHPRARDQVTELRWPMSMNEPDETVALRAEVAALRAENARLRGLLGKDAELPTGFGEILDALGRSNEPPGDLSNPFAWALKFKKADKP
jgi:hypothetical protein